MLKKSHEIEIPEITAETSIEAIFENDLLERRAEIENLTRIILEFDDPLVLALDAPWGSGKTTFVNLWQAYLKQQNKQSIFFNAWETDYAQDPLIVLVSELNKWVKNSNNPSLIEQWTDKIGKTLPNILKRVAIAGTKSATFGLLELDKLDKQIEGVIADLSGSIASDVLNNFNKQSDAIKQFKEAITVVLNELPAEQKNLVIFIDELDRCRPTYTIELLERIKHLFSIDRLVFVLSTDTTQLAHSIRAVYGNDFDAKKYLHRFIDFDYSLKQPEAENYIRIQLEVLGVIEKVKTRSKWQDEVDEIKNCFILFANRFNLKLRDINQLLMRFKLILYSIPNNYYISSPLIIALLILREQDKDLYQQYITSPKIASEVIEFLCKDFLPLEDYKEVNRTMTYTVASVIGYLIASNINHQTNNKEFENLIKPYQDKITAELYDDINKTVVLLSKKPYQSPTAFFSNSTFKTVVDRVELAHRINV